MNVIGTLSRVIGVISILLLTFGGLEKTGRIIVIVIGIICACGLYYEDYKMGRLDAFLSRFKRKKQ